MYGWLLAQLGYRTEEYFGRWLFGEPLTVPLRRHRVIKVFLPEGEFISDVGIGCQAPLVPFKCVLDEPQELSGRMYRIVADPVYGKIIQVVNGAVSRNYFSFDEAPQQPIDFMYAHYWCAHHPDSPFTGKLMVHVPTEFGRNSIASVADQETGMILPELSESLEDGTSRRTFLYGKEQLLDALSTYFGIHYDPKAISR